MNNDAAEKRLPMIDGKEVLTYSALSSFRNCGRKFDLRYQHGLTAEERAESLVRGSTVHNALEAYYLALKDGATEDIARDLMVKSIDNDCDGHHLGDDWTHDRWHHALAMTQAYVDRWCKPTDAFGQVVDAEYEVIDIEREFTAPIRNPATGAMSKTFMMAGKVDGVIRMDGKLYVLERKTAAEIDEGYLAKLWADFQSMLYANYLSEVYGEPFHGVLYDVIKKSRHKQKLPETEFGFEERIKKEVERRVTGLREKGPKVGETEDEFEERVGKLKTPAAIKKNREAGPKPGETSDAFEERVAAAATKKEADVRAKGMDPGETDEEFHERLMTLEGAYGGEHAQHRELILFDQERLAVIHEEVWDLTQQILAARRRGRFGMNTSNCYAFNRACDFATVCRAGRLDEITSVGLAEVTPHRELELVNPSSKKPATPGTTDDDLPF
jgi:hypothetical protein